MERNTITPAFSREKFIEYKQSVAFHEAGRAAGIHLNTKARHLPPAAFKVIFTEITEGAVAVYQTTDEHCIAQLEGGRLIEALPNSIDSLMDELTEHNDSILQLEKDYLIAFEVDIINLLIGPLAEARHIADTDNELFNHKLVDFKALKNYGGISTLDLVNKYLQSFSTDTQKDEKLAELFAEAFDFVKNDANWLAITRLADFILGSSSKKIIGCEEIALMLDHSIANFTDRRAVERQQHNTWFNVTGYPKISHAKSMENLKRPSQSELDSMTHREKDALILELFDLLGSV